MSKKPNLPQSVGWVNLGLQIPSRIEWIEKTIQYLQEQAERVGAFDPSRSAKVTMALHEALTNSVVHGNLEISSELKEQGFDAFAKVLAERSANDHYSSRIVDVRFDYDGDECRWTLTDQGKGFNVAKVMNPPPPDPDDFENMLASGRGIMMMKSLLDDIRYEMEGRRAILVLRKSSGQEKRETVRHSYLKPVRIAPFRDDGQVDWNAAYQAVSRDLSEKGVALLQTQDRVVRKLLVELKSEGETVLLPAEVCHCEPLENGVLQLGCRFLHAEQPGTVSASAAEAKADLKSVQSGVEQLLRDLSDQQLARDERRQHDRFSYTEAVEVEVPNETKIRKCYARDLSKGGIAFITTDPIQKVEVTVHLGKAEDAALKITSRVVRCEQLAQGFYDVGAAFLRWSK